MSEIAALMHRNLLEVFDERDEDRRRAVIARTYTPDVVFHDPDGTVTGHDAIDANAAALLAQAPDFVFRPLGEVRESVDLGVLAWGFGPAGGAPEVSGTDIALVENGLIRVMWTLLDVPG